ncbi:ASCH domain-containing protein [Verrucomicrobium spinosum]|uniref:ASCH domain-containing protein n=1 Tax=Verrucomicrobium spinosum TaxID=2736 RepID=UPI003CCDCBE8
MSIKPKYADLIFSGAKTVELRRVCPKLKPGDLVLVYASGPRMALIGKFEVKGILSGKKSAFYDEFGASSGISRAEFNSYFSGVATAHGIQIGRTWKLKPETSLNVLRRRFEGFHPPQSYRYLLEFEHASLTASQGNESTASTQGRLNA